MTALRDLTAGAGYTLRERLALYPEFRDDTRWRLSPRVRERIEAQVDEQGLVKPPLERH